MDKPEFGKVYSLTGTRSIASGDNWQASEVFCGGTKSDHPREACTNHLDHEHSGPRTIFHNKAAAVLNGCTPHRCGLKSA